MSPILDPYIYACFTLNRPVIHDNVDLMWRYKLSGHVLPSMREFMQKVIGIDIEHRSPAQV